MDIPAISDLASTPDRTLPLKVYGHETTLRRIPDDPGSSLSMVAVEFDKPVRIGSLRVEGLQANHYIEEHPDETPLHYLFADEDHQWFYGTDGCWLLKPTWLRLQRAELDLVIIDATLGRLESDARIFEHNSFDMVARMVGGFRGAGILRREARVVLTHLSLHANPPHDVLASEAAALGFVLAYDGLEIEL